jgi:hypothetical protein
VTPKVRPLNLFKALGGSFVVGGGDATSGTDDQRGSGGGGGGGGDGDGALVAAFSADAEQAEQAPLLGDAESSKDAKDPTKLRAREAIAQIFRSPLYLWTVSTGAIISGSTVFILYFVTQILEDLDFFGSTTLNYVFCGVLLVVSPIPGNIAGAYYVQRSLGGEKRDEESDSARGFSRALE